MSQTIRLQQFLDNQQFFIQEAKSGKTFIYPTDTIYGIGGLYTQTNVQKIFAIKQRDTKKMFSIIAPSFEWIRKNYQLRESNYDQLQKYLDRYHWVTYIFDYAKPGVRIIKHPFQSFVEHLDEPFITTSCNISWEPPLNNIQNISPDLTSKVDYIIDGWLLDGRPSVLIDMINGKIIER